MAWPPTTHQDVQDEIDIVRKVAGGDYYRSGYYSLGLFSGMSVSNATVSAGVVYARPFLVTSRRTFDRIGVNVSTAAGAGGTITMGIYSVSNGLPGTLLVAGGAVDATTIGAKESVISQTLNPGLYFLAVLPLTAGPVVNAWNSGEHANPYISTSTTVPTSTLSHAAFNSGTGITALPASGSGISTGNTMCPLICLRAA